ncbi:MAG: hypothetical protein QF464_15395, partial [Myxococcota bacterium]|nr:hypothetical protein [Myxococcota bacterium]
AEDTAIEAPTQGSGVWQPTVRSDGGAIAFSHRTSSMVRVRVAELGAEPIGLGSIVSEFDEVGGSEPWTWPNFDADGGLTASQRDDGTFCMKDNGVCDDIPYWNQSYRVTPGSGETPLMLGGTGFSLQDTYAHPTRPELLAGHGRFHAAMIDVYPVCDEAGQADTECTNVRSSPMPVVLSTETGQVWVLDLESHEAAYAVGGEPLKLTGCAHMAWAPDGKHLLCTEQGTAALAAGHTSRLYGLAFDPDDPPTEGVVLTTAEPMFDHATADALFDVPDGSNCGVFHHKYAEFCGHPHLVVATIGCADCDGADKCNEGGTPDEANAPTLLSDRVYLIDFSDPAAPQYVDLTAAVEVSRDLEPNSLTSFTATCTPSAQ